MGITVSPRPDYVVQKSITGPTAFPKIFNVPVNQYSFQIQWSSSITLGEFVVYGSNENPSKSQLPATEAFVPTLTKIPLASIDVNVAPYDTLDAGMIEVTTASAVVWVEYTGAQSGVVSIAFCGKTLG